LGALNDEQEYIPEDDLPNLIWWDDIIVLSQLLMDEHHVFLVLRHFGVQDFWIVKNEKLP
jgi:hypothetical protein